MKDFFISYTKVDAGYAKTIRSWLQDAGYEVVMQEPDFEAGSNFVLEMDRAAKEATRTIGVLSGDYLAAKFTQPEWAAAFAADPTGAKKRLVLIRVKPCTPEGLLKQVVYIDVVGLDMESARQRITDHLRGETEVSAPTPPKSTSRRKKAAPNTTLEQNAKAGRDVYQAGGDMVLNKKEVIRPVLPREEHHVSEQQAADIRSLLNELGERDEMAGRGATYGLWMNRFKDHFNITSYARLEASRYDEAIAWIKQQKAVNRSRLRRTSNKQWRNDHYAIIYGCLKTLNWDKPQMLQFAFEKLELKKPILSIKELGEQNLEKLSGIIKRLADKTEKGI